MRRNPNPRKPKTRKLALVEAEVINESETVENLSSDEPKTLVNEANWSSECEKQRESKTDQDIANSLMDLVQMNGKRKSPRLSRKIAKKSKVDGECKANDEDQEAVASDSSSTEEECEEEEEIIKEKKKIANVRNSKSASKKVEVPTKVLIPDSSLQFTGSCGEKICVVFPKAPQEEVKKLMDGYPKGFKGFDREQGEKVLKWIAGLKQDYWKLRRSHMKYPEFREKVVEGLPLPEGFNGFNLEESNQISEVIVTLEEAISKLKNFFQPSVREERYREKKCGIIPFLGKGAKSKGLPKMVFKDLQPSVHPEASGSLPSETTCPPVTQIPCTQQQPSVSTACPVQPDVPMFPYQFPGYGQYPPNWCPMGPYGMPPMSWNSYNPNYRPPSMGDRPRAPYYDAGMRPFPTWPSQDYGSA